MLRLPQLPGRITFLAPPLTHSSAPRKPTGVSVSGRRWAEAALANDHLATALSSVVCRAPRPSPGFPPASQRRRFRAREGQRLAQGQPPRAGRVVLIANIYWALGVCRALCMHHDSPSSGQTTFIAEWRKRRPERLSNSPPSHSYGMPPLTRETPACRVQAGASGTPTPAHLAVRTSIKVQLRLWFYRRDKKFVETSCRMGGVGRERGRSCRWRGWGLFLPPVAGNVRYLKHHRKVSWLNIFAGVT